MMIYFKPHQACSIMAPYLPTDPCFVEAGSFTGNDTLRMAAQWPQGIIHAFEPVEEIFTQLVAAAIPYPNVICHQLALSDSNGHATLHLSEKPSKPGIISQANSLRAPKERLVQSPLLFTRTIQVPTMTLDTWAQKKCIDRIDALWLDLQGHELSVLQSAPKILKTVRLIHIEVSFIESYENQPLYPEIQTWMNENGFTEVARDFKDTTTWFFGNAVFVRLVS